MWNIKSCSQRVRHAMNHAQAYVRERHTGNVLRNSHSVARFHIRRFGNSRFQIAGDHFNCLDFKHVAHLPCAFCNQTFNGMSQCIKTGCSRKTFRQRIHQFSVDNCYGRDVIRVYTHHLFMVFLISNHIIDCHFSCCTGCCGQSNDWN